MNDTFKISVITPVLNNVKYIEDAIKSVMIQDWPNYEHVVVDGGSKDGTLEILKKYNHLKLISESDTGQSNAMNKGFQMSTGQVIVYLNADDMINPGAFSIVNQYFLRGAMFVVGKIKVIDEKLNFWINDPKIKHEEILRYWEPQSYSVNPVGYYYRRKVQTTVNGFNETNHFTMDYEFLLETSKIFSFEKVREDVLLGVFRNIKGTKTHNFMTNRIFLDKREWHFAEKYLVQMSPEYIKKYVKDRNHYYIKKKLKFYFNKFKSFFRLN